MSTWKADTDVTSNTLEATEKSSDTPEATEVPSDTPEATEEPSNTPEVTEEPSNTPEATEAPSDTPEATEVPSDTPEATEEPSDTPEATEEPSDTPEATEVPSDTPENTYTPTETTEATVEDTATLTLTLTETSAAVSTDTPTPTATQTATATLTETVSGTATNTPTLTATATATETATATMTETVAGTPTEAPPAPFESAYYTYDGDDNMVMSVINDVTTYYPSSSYVVEVDGSDTTVRKTYSAGSTSLAVRTIVNSTENTLNWMLSDHLGSSSITTAADGTWNSEIRYSAFGETRYSSGIMPTDYRYTNQLEQKDVNLYYYNARYYDASLGRFIQADTIVPNPASQKSYDRYTYVNNNPIKYSDPSGHRIEKGGGYISTDPLPDSMKPDPTPIPTVTVDPCKGEFPESTPFDPSSWDITIPGDQWKSEFLNTVIRHKDELPEGMTVPLMLAIASAEKGVASNWSQVHDPHNPGNTDGFYQITPDNEFRMAAGYPYNDTYGGFEGIVVDAISYLSEISENWERQGIEEKFSDIPSGETVKLLLYFNGGQNPIVMYSGGGGNKDYLEDVSKYLVDSPFGCLYNDESLANDLISAQALLNERVKEFQDRGY